jgi:hypothetical protein
MLAAALTYAGPHPTEAVARLIEARGPPFFRTYLSTPSLRAPPIA